MKDENEMGEHSIEELKRQCEAAYGKKRAAEAAFEAARNRLHKARCKASGWLGETVETAGIRFVVFDVEFIGDDVPWRLGCNPVKKDGSPSLQTRYLYMDNDKPRKVSAAQPA